MVHLIRHDLEFILRQIEIAEAHSAAVEDIAGGNAVSQIGDELRNLVDSPLLPAGLRTVDGSYNNIVPGREKWGASGEPFVRLSQPHWVTGDDDSIVFGAGTPGAVTFTDGNYAEHGAPTDSRGLTGGTLVDADPRIISNLIVDQTLANPAAIAAALRLAGVSEAQFPTLIRDIQAAHRAQPDAMAALAAAQAGLAAAEQAHQQAMAAIADATDLAELPPLLAALTSATEARELAQDALEAAQEAAGALAGLLADNGIQMDGNTVLLPNQAPDEGLSAPYNAWFTLFGQFFDHGLDLVKKGGNGTVYIPLAEDDPLYDPGSPQTNFMAMTRATVGAGAANVTTPWVDQNQTYTSHASHQVFLREYAMGSDGKPVATGLLLEGTNGGLATWKDIKDQARAMLGIELTDADVGMVPLLRTDPYGRFIPDATTGYAQVVVGLGADGIPNTADDVVISGSPAAPASLANALRLPNAFLDDIAHAAVPIVNAAGVLQQDGDEAVGYSGGFNSRGQQTQYDNELLDAHYITGDGRGNENIGLTAVHFVFHAEHNRQIEEIKATVEQSGDAAFIAQWKLPDGSWNGERLFQAARFATEMQYQHLVFEEFARKIQPDIDIFIVQPDVELNPAIFAEFANVVYRFGHSMLNETVDRTYADGSKGGIDLFDAFLNPLEFGGTGLSQAEMAGAIALGMSAQHANEIDEFVTDVLRNQLVGIPLDLAALNIARGRDTGMPTLNQARAQFQDLANGDTLLRPYESWTDFALNLRNPESIINFIAAYGTHATVTAAQTLQGRRDAAMELVFGVDVDGDGTVAGDRQDFLNARGDYANRRGGLDDIDLWVGGLAEKKMAFGGMLGSTFSFIFQLQMENLQDADRFYYLSRTQGLNLLTELENNSLSKIVMRNTNLGEEGLALPADIFSTPDHVFYVDLARQLQITGLADPTHENPVLQALSALVERAAGYIRYNGLDHVTIQGTDGDDHIISGGGDDAVWGGAGNDRIEAGYGVDSISGGAGDDIITSAGTDIGAVTVMKGESGNDVIVDGTGMSLIFGGDGKDYLVSGLDDGEIRGGQGDDFIFGGDGAGMLFGNEGDDWIEGGGGFDYIAGDNGELFFNSTILGHDVLNGGAGDTDYDADSGDDIMFAGEGIQKNIGMWGHDWVIHQGQKTGVDADMRIDIFTTLPAEVLRDRFSQVEGLSGWHHDDVLRGDDRSGVGAEGGATVDPTPEGNLRYNELNRAAIDRIAGLDEIVTDDLMIDGEYWADGSWENGATGTSERIFVGGNILLGGGGSDTIEGRGGDDIIDGDRYLNVRIAGQTKDGIAFSVSSLEDKLTLGGVEKSLTSWMVEGRINPGALEIVREILSDSSGVDTAVYWDVYENYEITSNAHGGLVVSHVTQTAGATDPVSGRNRVSDGTDTVYNVEFLRFADRTVSTTGLINAPATGVPLIVDPTPTNGRVSPTEGLPLGSSLAGIADANGRPTSAAAYSYQWQVSANGGGTWTDIANATGANFTPSDGILGIGGQVGGLLRLRVSFTDNDGHQEVLFSAPTNVVGDNWDAIPLVANTFNGTEGDDIADGTSGLLGLGANDTLNGNGGNDILSGAGGNDTLNGGAGDDRLDGGAGSDTAVYAGAAANFALGSSGSNLIVTDLTGAEGTDTLSTIETLRFAGINHAVVAGTAGDNVNLNGAAGAAGAQAVFGLAGNDSLNGGGGNDLLVGGAGNDTIRGGAGNDTVYWSVGDGRDVINGDTDAANIAGTVDTVKIVGDGSAEIYRIYSRAAAVAEGIMGLAADTEIVITRNGTTSASVIAELNNIEEIVINGRGGGDSFIPIGDFTPTSLLTSTITLEGSQGDDTVDISGLQSAHRIVFRSNGGNDTIIGTLRAQDVIELPEGSDPDGYTRSYDAASGVSTLSNGIQAISFAGDFDPVLAVTEHGAGENEEEDEDEDGGSCGRDDDDDSEEDEDSGGRDDDDDEVAPLPASGSLRTGTPQADVLVGTAGADSIVGFEGDDVLFGEAGDDVISAGAGDDFVEAGAGDDIVFLGAGNDQAFGGAGNDTLYGEGGDDRLFGGAGEDRLEGGYGNDTLVGGAGNDLFIATIGDGDDTYHGDDLGGGSGVDTLDMSAITVAATVDLGSGLLGRGSAVSSQTGRDTLWGIENVATGSGNDTITASDAVNVIEGGAGDDVSRFTSAQAANGDTILDFAPGDRLDLSAIDADRGTAGDQSFTIVSGSAFTASAQLLVTYETRADGDYTVVSGNTGGGLDADFQISLKGTHTLGSGNVVL